MNKIRQNATEVLLEFGVRPHLSGFNYLVEIVSTYEKKDLAKQLTKRIYPGVAEKYNSTWSKVERAIRTAIHTSRGNYSKYCPGEFIGLVLKRIKNLPDASKWGLKKVIEYRLTEARAPVELELVKAKELAKLEDAIIKLTWGIRFGGIYHVEVTEDSNINELLSKLPKKYGV